MGQVDPDLPLTRQRILVVDDDPSTRLLCRHTLEKAGYIVLEAEGSSEAMVCWTTSTAPINLLLTDVFLPPPDFQVRSATNQFPRVNGPELVLQVLSIQKEVRAILMSSHPLASLESKGIVIQPEHFLPKPLSAERLLQQVRSALTAKPTCLKSHSAMSTDQVQWFD